MPHHASRSGSLLLATALVATVLLAACGESAEPARDTEVTLEVAEIPLPTGAVAGKPWATAACPARPWPADVLACVDGIAITRARFDAARPHYPADTPPRAIVQALIDEEVLAAAAGARGLWRQDLLDTVLRRQLASQLLVQSQERAFGPAQIADADIALAFKHPSIVTRYDRAPAYFVTDAQFLCCRGDFRQCEASPDVQACLQRVEPQARALYEELRQQPPASGEAMTGRTMAQVARYPDVIVKEFSFYYDKNKTYAEQKGYELMVEPFAVNVVQLRPGELAPPVQTPFGWHVTRLDRFDPGAKRSWQEPEVRREIAENIIDLVREREAVAFTFGLMKAAGVELFYDRLEPPKPAAEAVEVLE